MLRGRGNLYDSLLNRPHYEFRSFVDAELPHQVELVAIYRLAAQTQGHCRRTHRFSFRQQLQDFLLASG
jgi:hypothetical protein